MVRCVSLVARFGQVCRDALLSQVCRLMIAIGFALSLGGSAFATDPAPLIPDVGFDVADYITEAGTAMAVVAGVVVGFYFMFLIVRKGMSWGRKAI